MGVLNVTPDSFSDGGQWLDRDSAVLHGVEMFAEGAGVEEVWIDPGIGFGKTIDHNLALLRNLGVLVDTGLPVVVGTSRKSFLGRLTGGAPAEDRLEASVATATWAMAQGAGMVRVHDVRPTAQA